MKNLMVYVNPRKDWDSENKKLVKLQIDNSLELGWDKKDILLFTNFPYEYEGIVSTIVPDELFCPYFHQMSKINTILWMFENGMIEDDTYWFHDMEAFQNQPIDFKLTQDLAITDYGYWTLWNTGSFFFNNKAQDILALVKEESDKYSLKGGEEESLERLINRGEITRYEVLNITYNFPGSVKAVKKIKMIYDKADKPIKVLHFHPDRFNGAFYKVMTGENELGVSLMTERLKKLFNKYGWK